MQSVIPPGEPHRTVIAGKAQGYLGLAVNYGIVTDPQFPGVIFPSMTTAWQPNPDELAAINDGAPILVRLIGDPPINPMAVYVGEIPSDG